MGAVHPEFREDLVLPVENEQRPPELIKEDCDPIDGLLGIGCYLRGQSRDNIGFRRQPIVGDLHPAPGFETHALLGICGDLSQHLDSQEQSPFRLVLLGRRGFGVCFHTSGRSACDRSSSPSSVRDRCATRSPIESGAR